MKYIIVAVILSYVTTRVTAQSNKESNFKQVESLKNKISDQSLVVRYDEVRSKVSCARECSNNNQCTSFFYNKNQRFCSLHSESEIGLDQTNDMEGTMFFKLEKDYSSKGYTFNEKAGIWYKGYRKGLTQRLAVKKCESDGAVLISPITQQKRELIEQIYKKVFGGVAPWIGCWKTETGQWIWKDGTPMAGNNWLPNHPYSGKSCCRQFKKKWLSYSCDGKWPLVCEISP